jgi:hypothetical protein
MRPDADDVAYSIHRWGWVNVQAQALVAVGWVCCLLGVVAFIIAGQLRHPAPFAIGSGVAAIAFVPYAVLSWIQYLRLRSIVMGALLETDLIDSGSVVRWGGFLSLGTSWVSAFGQLEDGAVVLLTMRYRLTWFGPLEVMAMARVSRAGPPLVAIVRPDRSTVSPSAMRPLVDEVSRCVRTRLRSGLWTKVVLTPSYLQAVAMNCPRARDLMEAVKELNDAWPRPEAHLAIAGYRSDLRAPPEVIADAEQSAETAWHQFARPRKMPIIGWPNEHTNA